MAWMKHGETSEPGGQAGALKYASQARQEIPLVGHKMFLAQGNQAFAQPQTKTPADHGGVPEKWFFVAMVTILVDYAICPPYTLFIAGSESDSSTMDDSLTNIYIGERLRADTSTGILWGYLP